MEQLHLPGECHWSWALEYQWTFTRKGRVRGDGVITRNLEWHLKFYRNVKEPKNDQGC